MTGGLVVVLGAVGPNFAAGMTGGLAYVHDPTGALERHVNVDLVELRELTAEHRHELADLLRRHARHASSVFARDMLRAWPRGAVAFRAVVPRAAASRATLDPGSSGSRLDAVPHGAVGLG
jgi:glutamate synthase (NADPH/NADH) large chain